MRGIVCGVVAMLCAASLGRAVEMGEGLVAEWTFEEAEGVVARDTSDNNNNGTLRGPERVAEGIGRCLRFNGTSDYVDCGTAATLDITERISLEAWVNPAGPSIGEPLLVGKGIYVYGLTWSGSTLYFYISDGAWNCRAEIPMNAWSHVAGTYDGTRMRLFVNGEPVCGFVMPEANTPIKSSGNSVTLGRYEKGFFRGMLDNVRIYNRVLSEKEVRAHYAEEAPRIRKTVVRREDLKGLALRVFDAGPQPQTLIVSGVETVEGDLTIPGHIRLRVEMGGALDVRDGTTLTLLGPLDAPLSPIFRGAGRVLCGTARIEKVYAQWWGAAGDGRSDDAAAIQSAMDALPRGGVVCLTNGTYAVGATLRFHSGLSLEGPATLRSLRPLPAILQSANPAARSGGIRLRRLGIVGRGVDGENSGVGLDLTNVCASLVEDVSVASCGTGIRMDGPVFCGYNNLMRIAIGDCRVGMSLSNSTIKTSLIGSQIGAVGTGVLVETANELEIFGLSIEGFRDAGIDVRRGDTVHMHHLYFANGVESGVGIRIAPGVSESTIIGPRFSRVATPIDNQAKDTVILDDAEPSAVLRTRALIAQGIAAPPSGASNLRGEVVLAGDRARATVRFAVPEPDARYFVVATVVSDGDMTAAQPVSIARKGAEGFDVLLAQPPGEGREVRVHWLLVR